MMGVVFLLLLAKKKRSAYPWFLQQISLHEAEKKNMYVRERSDHRHIVRSGGTTPPLCVTLSHIYGIVKR